MRPYKKMIIFTLIILLNISILSGCLNYREIDTFLIVSGVAIDKEDDNYILYIETISPKGGEKTEMEAKVFTAKGKTVFDAIRNSIQISGKKMYWSHCQVVVISQSIAKDEIIPVLDFFNRSIEVRSDIRLLISIDESAKDILQSKELLQVTTSFYIADVFQAKNSIPKFPVVEMWKFLDALSAKDVSPIIPTIQTRKVSDSESLQIFGTAVLDNDRMIGWLDELDTRNLLILTEKDFRGGIIIVEDVDSEKKIDTTFEIASCKTKMKPQLKNDILSIVINIEMDMEIVEITGSEDYICKEGREKLKKYSEEFISKQIAATICKVQTDYQTDIFGFGGAVQRKMPAKWDEFQGSWKEIFSQIGTDINVDLKIQGSSLTSKPIKVSE